MTDNMVKKEAGKDKGIPCVIEEMAKAGWKVSDGRNKILVKEFPDVRMPEAVWTVALSGSRTLQHVKVCDQDIEVPPFTAIIFWNDFPAGIVDMAGGAIAAGGGANEDALIEAIRATGVKP